MGLPALAPGLRAGFSRGYRPVGLPAGLRDCDHLFPGRRFSSFFFKPVPSDCILTRTE